MQANYFRNSFLHLAVTFVFVMVFSFIPEGASLIGWKLKPMDLFMDVHPDPAPVNPASGFIPSDNEFRVQSASVLGGSVTFTGCATTDNLTTPAPAMPEAAAIDNPAALKSFFEALRAGGKKIRVAHYGDSAIEGDNISADLRKNLQMRFQGNGVGLVGMSSQDVQFRTTTKMSFSPDWKTPSLITSNPEKAPLGMNGYAYIPVAGSWTKFETTTQYGVKFFTMVRIVYSSDKAFKVKYSFDDKPETVVDLKPSAMITEQVISANGKAKSFKMTVVDPGKTFFYGVSLEDANGVYVDNFPLRGNSGEALRNLDVTRLREFDRLFGYKLIVLNFGLNMTDGKDFSWYEAAMEKVLATYKSAFPQTSILIVSVQDKSEKKGTAFVTKESVPLLVAAQKRIAQKAGVAFWNLFEAMGGTNSMSSWVSQGLAEKDYTHVKLTGAKKIADMLSEALISAFNSSK